MKFSIKDIVIIAAGISIVFVQEQILAFLPNIQLTMLLLVLYSKKLGFLKTSIIILIYTLLDCLVTGSLNLFYFPFVLFGWMSVPVLTSLFRKYETPFCLSLIGVVCSLIYSWLFIIPNVVFVNEITSLSGILNYLAADLIFEVLLVCSSFVTILWLYTPCSLVFDKVLNEFNHK